MGIRSPKSANQASAPSCKKCKKNLTAVKFPGVICSGCQISFHFACSSINKDNWPLYSDKQNPKVFLCVECTKKQRRSAEYSATSSDTATPQRNTNSNATSSNKNDDIKALREQLALVLKELQEAKVRISQLEAQKNVLEAGKTNSGSDRPTTLKEGTAFFTINGIPQTDGEEVQSITEAVLSLKTPNFKLDGTATVSRLASKDHKHHSILIGVRRNSPLFESFNKARGSSFKGEEAGFPSVHRIHINESHTSLSYRLFKKAKALRKDYSFIWIRNSRVFVRKTENSKIIPIYNEDTLEKLLNPQG